MSKPRKCTCGGCAYCLHRDRMTQYQRNSKARKEKGKVDAQLKYPMQITIWETSDGSWHNDELSAYRYQMDLFRQDKGR